MHRMWKAVLGVAVLIAACAAPAVAQEKKERILKSDGKRYHWVEVTAAPAETTMLVEVPRGEGVIVGTKRVGKNTELAAYRRVAVEAVAKGHTCVTRTALVLKNTELKHLCVVDGAEQPCPGMNEKGECQAKK